MGAQDNRGYKATEREATGVRDNGRAGMAPRPSAHALSGPNRRQPEPEKIAERVSRP
jgi:hypothetical protein